MPPDNLNDSHLSGPPVGMVDTSAQKGTRDAKANHLIVESPIPPWRESAVKRTANIHYFITCGICFIFLFVGVFLTLSSQNYTTGASNVYRVSWGAAFLTASLLTVVVAAVRLTNARSRYREIEESKSREAVDTAIEQLKDEVSFASLLKVNQTQMDQYHDITKHQAENAYRNSQIAMGAGLLILASIVHGS